MSRQKRERELHTDVIIILVDIFCNFVPVDADDDVLIIIIVFFYSITFVNIAAPKMQSFGRNFLPNIY